MPVVYQFLSTECTSIWWNSFCGAVHCRVFLASTALTHCDSESHTEWVKPSPPFQSPLVEPVMDLLLSPQPVPWNLMVLGLLCDLVCGDPGGLRCSEWSHACRATLLLFPMETELPSWKSARGKLWVPSLEVPQTSSSPLSWGQSCSSSCCCATPVPTFILQSHPKCSGFFLSP